MSADSRAVIVDTVQGLRSRLATSRSAGRRVALVPTMGALHDGHLALIREAARDADEVVVSIFVNPAQFTQASDLETYPRELDADVSASASAGATVVFAPTVDEVYPSGFATSIRVAGITERWEGASRGAAHFDGVALVVAKLLGMVRPDTAWFGRKDAQQVAVVRRLVADLDIPTHIHAVDTVRDADGLALSSRNVRLSTADRARSTALYASLIAARDAVSAGQRDPARIAAVAREVLAGSAITPEYWELVDPVTFERVRRVDAGALAIVAAFVGDVRLIDNLTVA